ncbi:MAG: hypothetical protein ACPGQD_05470 [Planctomycetota bacterium]
MTTLTIGAEPGAAGTAVEFRDGAPAATPSPFGTTLKVGAYQWGRVNEVVDHSGVGHFNAHRGGVMEDDPTPLNCLHFYRLAKGAGKLLTLRLTDGNEAQSSLEVYTRDIARSYGLLEPYAQPTRAMVVKGRYPGRRGGRVRYYAGHLADLAAAFDAAAGTFATGVTMPENAYEQATLRIDGHPTTYVVTGNSTAGLLSIQVASNDSGPSGAGKWSLELTHADASGDGTRDGLAVQIVGSEGQASSEFGLATWDWRTEADAKPRYKSLSLDSTRDSYAPQVVEDEGKADIQHHLAVEADALGDPNSSEMRPANRTYLVDGASGVTNVVTVRTQYWSRTVGAGGNAFLAPAETVYPSGRIRCKAICTFVDATTFNVEFQLWDGTVISTGHTVAASSGGTLGTLFAPGTQFLPSFKLYAGGSAMQANDTVTVWFDPLPADLASLNGALYPHATSDSGTDIRTALAIISNTATTITLAATVTLGTTYSVAAAGRPEGTSTDAGTYNLAGSETFKYQINSESVVTLTQTLSGAAVTRAQLVDELNTQEAATNTPARVQFEDGTTGITVRALHNAGAGQQLTITDGTLNAIIGFTNSTDLDGSNGSVVAVSFRESLLGGLDGIAGLGSGTEYTDAWDVVSSPINAISAKNYGLIKMAMPGVSDATTQNAMIAYAEAKGHACRCEVPTSAATDAATAARWVRDNLTADRNRSILWDSYGYPRRKPFPGVEAAYPMTGAVLGAEAALARDRRGYHIAAAGTKASIGEIFAYPASANGEAYPAPSDDKVLNQVGVQAIRKEGAALYPWGDENSEDGYFGTVWKHKIECILHIGHELRFAGLPFVWEANDPATRARLVAAITPLFKRKFNDGWFARRAGQSFEDVVIIRAGDAENPPEIANAGDMVCTIELVNGIVDTAKRVVFGLGTGGVTVSF